MNLCKHSSALCPAPECHEPMRGGCGPEACFTCNQGRNCPVPATALHRIPATEGMSFPLDSEQDEAFISPESAGLWSVAAQVLLALVTVACVAGVVINFLKH